MPPNIVDNALRFRARRLAPLKRAFGVHHTPPPFHRLKRLPIQQTPEPLQDQILAIVVAAEEPGPRSPSFVMDLVGQGSF